MQKIFKRSPFSQLSGFGSNAVMHIILASGVAFVTIQIIRIIFLVMYGKEFGQGMYDASVIPGIALHDVHLFFSKFWTVFTYGWFHNGFWELFSNMLWFYCFGSLVQMLVGYKQVIPLFIYSMAVGGIFYLLGQFIPAAIFSGRPYLMGPLAAIAGMASAAITIAPQYRFFLTDRFSIPIWVVVGIFALLMFLNIFAFPPMVFLFLGGALTGFGYIRLLQNGYKPGEWMYNVYGRIEGWFTPDENASWKKHNKKRNEILSKIEDRQAYTQKRIDDILDKINQKGYNSLSNEEKDILMRASKGNN